MPYTISHTAVVLPFARLLARWRLLAAVLIGAMVPDFGVFSPWQFSRIETHSLPALITFCLPVGLATYWTFQFLIKPAMAEILPDAPYSRWQAFAAPESVFSVRQWLLAAFGILAGALSHLLLDGFSHDNGRGVRMFPSLDEPLFDIGRRHVVASRLIQDFGSVVGLVVVFGVIWYGLRPAAQAPLEDRHLRKAERIQWAIGYATAAAILSVVFYLVTREHYPPGLHSVIASIYDTAVAVLRGLAAAVLGVSVALTLRLKLPR
jgi:Domain of unknown function (DUF4184)